MRYLLVAALVIGLVASGVYYAEGPISPYRQINVTVNRGYADITANFIETSPDYCRVQQLYAGLTLQDMQSLGWYPCGYSFGLRSCIVHVNGHTGLVWHRVSCGTTSISVKGVDLRNVTLPIVGMRNSGYTNKYYGNLTVRVY